MSINQGNVVSNLIWRFAERSGAQIVAFVVSIVLARLLDPSAYGTVALITVFTSILQVFVDSGLGNALIQKKNADDLDFSTVFYTNIIFCTVLYVVLFISAPFIAQFYEDLSMIPYIRVLGLTLIVSGIRNVQQAYVSKHMMFKKFFFSTLVGTIVSAIVGITMALMKFGIWALVAQQIVNVAIGTIMLWVTVNWKPKLQFSFERLKALFSYGWKLLLASLVNTVYADLRQLIIGKLYSSSDLAYYNQAKKMPNLIVTNINSSIDSVLLPVMSSVQDEQGRVKNMARRSIMTSIYIMAPLMIGLAVVAEPVINIILTEKWADSVPYLRIFCVYFMFYPVHTANLNAIKALGRSDLFLKLEMAKKAVGLILLFITMQISVMAMAYSLLISSILNQIINSWPNKRLLNYGYLEQVKDFMPSILLALVMGICIYPIGLLNLPDIVVLIVQVVIGALVYIVGSVFLKLNAFQYLWGILKPMVAKICKKKREM